MSETHYCPHCDKEIFDFNTVDGDHDQCGHPAEPIKTLQKGVYNENCNRTSCQQPPATYFNFSTRAYYCEECASLINDANRKDALRLYGHDLCIEGEHRANEQTQEYERVPTDMTKGGIAHS